MSRRGSVRKQQNGTWGLVVDMAGTGGNRQQVRRRGFATRREAQTALTELLASMQHGTFVKPERLSVGDYLTEWMDALSSTGRGPSTVYSYQSNLRLHVVPFIGDVYLQALTALDLDRLYRQLLENGRQGGGQLSPRTVRYIHTILSAALKDAVNKGLLSRNPALASSPPAAGATKAPEMSWWRPDQLKEFLKFVAEDDIGSLIRVAAMTGMRRGEVVGLRWVDVDLAAGRLTVRRQLASVNYKVRWDRPKSEKGRRTIDLDDDTLSVLEQGREQLSALPANELGLVFPRADGTPRHPEQVSSTFERLVARSGLPRIRMHDLRHTHAAHLIAAGVDPLTISRRLGHASVSFTLDRYGHLMAQAGANAASAVARLVDDPDEPDGIDPDQR